MKESTKNIILYSGVIRNRGQVKPVYNLMSLFAVTTETRPECCEFIQYTILTSLYFEHVSIDSE